VLVQVDQENRKSRVLILLYQLRQVFTALAMLNKFKDSCNSTTNNDRDPHCLPTAGTVGGLVFLWNFAAHETTAVWIGLDHQCDDNSIGCLDRDTC